MTKSELIKHLKTYKKTLDSKKETFAGECADAISVVINRLNKIKHRSSYVSIYNQIKAHANSLSVHYSNSNQRTNLISQLFIHSGSLVNPPTSSHFLKAEEKVNAYLQNIEEMKSRVEAHKDSANNFIKELIKTKSKAETDIAKLSEIVTAGVYSETASQEFGKASTMRSWAIVSFIVAAITAMVLIILSIGNSGDEITTINILSKVIASGVISLPGFYMARESSRHYKEAVRSQRIAHELSSLDNYLLDVSSPDLKDQIKSLLASRYFGNADKIYSVNDESMPNDKFIKAITDIATKPFNNTGK